jgi:pyruvate/2-oxoglutarate dehydrogenase complex dihydrolipoamide acyltransferase (E2) component
LSDAFIAELKRTGEAKRVVVFPAPVDGVVIEKMGVAGQMMKPGERIYRLADLSSVWVLAQVYEKDLPYLKPGQPTTVTTSYGPERKFTGTVELLLPQVEEQTRAATARIVLPNPDGFLRPGMFVEVSFTTQLSDDAVLVPDMAVLRSGERNTVFVALDDGFFEPREVTLGARSEGGFYQVLDGVKAGERVVTSGQFMLDSESQLREAIQKMLKPAAAPAATPAAPADHASHGKQADAAEPAPAAAQLKALAFAAADAAAALAADDLAGYRQQLPALRTAVAAIKAGTPRSSLVRFAGSLTEPADLKSARAQFEPLSTAVADAARQQHLHHTAGLHVFECPMAPATGKARWLQRTSGTKNPFFGSQMPTCGEELDASPSTGATNSGGGAGVALALPPGHPPIAGVTSRMSANDFLRSQMGFAPARAIAATATVDDDACGSCGMSATAMAAGEPCGHEQK